MRTQKTRVSCNNTNKFRVCFCVTKSSEIYKGEIYCRYIRNVHYALRILYNFIFEKYIFFFHYLNLEKNYNRYNSDICTLILKFNRL